MANAYVEMDAKQYVKFMKEQMAAKARAKNFAKVKVSEGVEDEVVLTGAQKFAGWLMQKLGQMVGLRGNSIANPHTLEEVGAQINKNIGANFGALRNYCKNIPGRVSRFFLGLGDKVAGWLTKLGEAATNGAEWMRGASKLTIGGTPLSNGTVVALAVLSAIILIAGYKFFKGLANKADQQNNQNQNQNNTQNVQQNQNAQNNNAQTNNAQPAEGTLYSDELVSYLDEGTRLTNEIMDAFTEQTELTEGIFDMFGWLVKMIKKAFNMVKEVFGYIGRFIKQHPIVAILAMVCIFFILFCTPALQTILGFWGKYDFSGLPIQ